MNKDENIVVERLSDKRFRHQYDVHKRFSEYLSQGVTLRQLNRETGTVIRVLPNSTTIRIVGEKEEDVVKAKKHIKEFKSGVKNSLRFTHFVSIPTNTDEIRENFNKFKESVMKNGRNYAAGLQEDMFAEAGTLHLTVSMVLILDDEDKEKAIQALERCKRDIVLPMLHESGPITIELKGIKSSNSNNSAKSKFLYFEVYEPTGYLLKISNKVFEHFLEQGLTRKEYNKKTLHITAVNIRNAKKENSFVKPFDATNILKDFQSTYFGKVTLSTLHLSQIKTRTEDGYYDNIAKIDVDIF